MMAVLTEPTHPLFLRCVGSLGAGSWDTLPGSPKDLVACLLFAARDLPAASLSPRVASLVATGLATGMMRVVARDNSMWRLMEEDEAALQSIMQLGVAAAEAGQRMSQSKLQLGLKLASCVAYPEHLTGV
jgi:hypothetical protein